MTNYNKFTLYAFDDKEMDKVKRLRVKIKDVSLKNAKADQISLTEQISQALTPEEKKSLLDLRNKFRSEALLASEEGPENIAEIDDHFYRILGVGEVQKEKDHLRNYHDTWEFAVKSGIPIQHMYSYGEGKMSPSALKHLLELTVELSENYGHDGYIKDALITIVRKAVDKHFPFSRSSVHAILKTLEEIKEVASKKRMHYLDGIVVALYNLFADRPPFTAAKEKIHQMWTAFNQGEIGIFEGERANIIHYKLKEKDKTDRGDKQKTDDQAVN